VITMTDPSVVIGCSFSVPLCIQHGDACELLLRHAGAEVDETLVPGKTDLAELLTHAPEAFAEPDKVNSTLTKMQRLELRKNKNQFTSGEDNLILRGVVRSPMFRHCIVERCY
jgi:hypothetical protein